MATTLPEGIVVPAGGDSYNLTADLRRMMESATTTVPVANAAARTALVAALTAAGRTPSVTDPLVILRNDAPDGAKIEFTQNGSAWVTVPTSSAWTPLTIAAGYAVVGGSRIPATRIHGDSIQLRGGKVRWASGSAAVAAGGVYTSVTGIPAAHRPTVPEWDTGSIFLSGTTPALCTVTVSGADILITPSVTGSLGSTDPSQIIIPDMRWDRA